MNTIKLSGYAFVSHVDNSIYPEIEINLNNIYTSKHHSLLHNLQHYGCIKSMGYLFDAKDYLKKYLVKQYGNWNEFYGPNKTTLRKSFYGKIDKIIEINNK